MTSNATPAQLERGLQLLDEVNGPSAGPPVTIRVTVEASGPAANAVQELHRAKVLFQARALALALGAEPPTHIGEPRAKDR